MSDKIILFYDKDNNRYISPVESASDPNCYVCLILKLEGKHFRIEDRIILGKNEFSGMESVTYRKYKLEDPLHPDGGPTMIFMCEKACVFCDHCTDIFWDYTNGIYAKICELHETMKNGCPDFVETK